MKKILLLLSIIILALSVKAQKKTILGITGGANFSTLTSKEWKESDRKVGFYLGILTDIPLTNKFSIQSELLYATYGADVIVWTVPRLSEIEYSFDYIQIPIAGKLDIYRGLSIEIGPSFNFLVREKGYRPGSMNIVDGDGNIIRNQKDIDPYGSNFELSGLVGVSYKLNKSWVVSARYTQGLSNAFDPDSGQEDAKNNAFRFGLGYIF
jgi:hypothetical protein